MKSFQTTLLSILAISVFLYIHLNGSAVREKYTDIKSPVMYGRMSCGYTVKMINALKDANKLSVFDFVDTGTSQGSKKLEEAGGSGVPHFAHNGRVAVGFMPVSTLMHKLNLV